MLTDDLQPVNLQLDSALLRSGRFGRHIQFKQLQKRQLAQMFGTSDINCYSQLYFADVINAIQLKNKNSDNLHNFLQNCKKVVNQYNQPYIPLYSAEVNLQLQQRLQNQIKMLNDNFNIKSQIALQLQVKTQSVLLLGPSASGKTWLISKLIELHSNYYNFIEISSTDIFSQYLGESEQNLIKIFNYCISLNNCILIIDNIDNLIQKRSNEKGSEVQNAVLSQLLTLMDGVCDNMKNLYVIGTACCQQDEIDSALTRFGRFGLIINLFQ